MTCTVKDLLGGHDLTKAQNAVLNELRLQHITKNRFKAGGTSQFIPDSREQQQLTSAPPTQSMDSIANLSDGDENERGASSLRKLHYRYGKLEEHVLKVT